MEISVGLFSYFAGTLGYLVLTLYALWSGHKKHTGRALIVAALMSFLWSGAIVIQSTYDLMIFEIRFTLEILRNAAWFFFLLRTLGASSKTIAQDGNRPTLYLSIFAIIISVFPLFLILTSRWNLVIFFDEQNLGSNFLICLISATILGLVLVEQVLRNTRSEKQWNIKFLGLGIGALFSYDFFLYSEALLFNRINSTLWDTRGAINLLAIPFIIIASQRSRAEPLKFNLSHEFMFHSSALVGTGLYLLVMSVAGYYIRLFGGTWGGVLQTLFFTTALLILVTLVFSGKIRAKFRVFISRNFFNYKYDYRDEWIRITQTLSQEGEDPLAQRLIRALANIVQSPGGQLWLLTDADTFTLSDTFSMAAPHITVESGNSRFCTFLRETEWVIDLDEFQRDPDLYGNLELPDWLRGQQSAWLVIPLMLHQALYGFVILKKSQTTHVLNWEDHDLIKIAGRQVASYIAQQEATQALSQAREFQAFNQMSAFVVHDIKTLVAQLSLLVKNAEKHKSNPAFVDDMVKTTHHSVQKMTHLLEQLKSGSAANPSNHIELNKLVREIIKSKSNRLPLPSLTSLCEKVTVDADQEQLSSVIGHLVQNAQEASAENGNIEIKVDRDNEWALIKILDNGAGMSEEYIQQKLFQPFQSTKGVTGMGIGVYQCQQYIRRIGGGIKVKSELGIGSEFDIFIPIAK